MPGASGRDWRGHNFGLHLRDCRFPVEMVNVSKPCESKPNWGENDPARRFVNLKACYYQALADALERDQIEGLMDEMTIGQLAGLLYEVDSQGRMKIESKEKARERGIPSPDRAEALMLALGQPRQKMEVYFLRDLPRLRAEVAQSSSLGAEHPYWGFREVPYREDDDNIIRRRRWPRGLEVF